MRTGTPSAVVVMPSAGLGGGIERYSGGVCEGLTAIGVDVRTVALAPLNRRAAVQKMRLLLRTVTIVLTQRPQQILLMHPGLLPVAVVLRVVCPSARLSLFLYGSDIWTGIPLWTRTLLRRWTDLQLITISSFSAGALTVAARVPTIVHPTLRRDWHVVLDKAARPAASRDIDCLTVFRLSEWHSKGGPIFLDAVSRLSATRTVHAVAAGRGPVPPEVARECAAAGVDLMVDVSDDQLADLYGRTKVFVLSTHLSAGRGASGEGFGIVLIEAQAAGAAVVAPRNGGGSSDAYVPGLTGEAGDEDAAKLAKLLGGLLDEDRSAAARDLVRRQFSAGRLERDLQDIFFPVGATASPSTS